VEAVTLLVEYSIDRYARKVGKDIRRVNKKTLQLLQPYPWPGNIRELQNVIERSVILCETDPLPLKSTVIDSGFGLHLDYEFRPNPTIVSIFFYSVSAGFIIIAVEFGWPLESSR
jgi:transcriptional regulator with AAA-type ATPase domain